MRLRVQPRDSSFVVQVYVMTGPQPLLITVSSLQQDVLDGLLRQHSCPQTLALRIRIVVGAAAGRRNEPLARHRGCQPQTVRKWRARWAAAESAVAAAERDPRDLRRIIATVLADAPRPGAPDTFTAEQIIQI